MVEHNNGVKRSLCIDGLVWVRRHCNNLPFESVPTPREGRLHGIVGQWATIFYQWALATARPIWSVAMAMLAAAPCARGPVGAFTVRVPACGGAVRCAARVGSW